ncbi:MAG: orotidine-5'-phosphate decarboxylase [Halobacteriovoraceae bacterium]|nr:orotidine-5'-phosphate decarboxylase [Halobacteriovoraceae bacterium]
MTGLQKTIVARDNMDKQKMDGFLQKVSGRISTVKIGTELYYRYGRELIDHIHEKHQMDIFLDLKFHDIPNTVEKTIAVLQGLPLKFATIHLSGGNTMLKQAVKQIKQTLPSTRLLGVGILTSLDMEDIREMWGMEDMNQCFSRLALLNIKNQIPGMILSPRELPLIGKMEKDTGTSLIKVCPGIRFSTDKQDQKRVATPAEALKAGADYLVLGRALTESSQLEKRLQELASL